MAALMHRTANLARGVGRAWPSLVMDSASGAWVECANTRNTYLDMTSGIGVTNTGSLQEPRARLSRTTVFLTPHHCSTNQVR